MINISHVINIIYKKVAIIFAKLEYIVEVAKLKSINKAAISLNITQPAISHAIKQFEEKVGYSIFHRTKNGTYPTQDGLIIIEKAIEILDKVSELEMLYTTNVVNHNIKIVSTPGIINQLLKAVGKYNSNYPNIDVFISEENSEDIINMIIDENVDAGFLIYSEDDEPVSDALSFTSIEKVEMKAAVRSDSFYFQQGFINYSDLKKEKVVLYEEKHTRKFESDYITKYGEMNVSFRTKNSEAIFIAIKENNAITIGYDYAIKASQAFHNQEIQLVEIKGFEQSHMNIGWLTNGKNNVSKYVTNFINEFNKL